eukprot:CAMPEP_0180660880 /NCGR_PEP_ID=MMETSP1037_2-20121125/58502_1 /TAXON_ID=632150 /ORGANISM="Azadinium spinosum, Strain 3D9" /LENGTH=60 /DNA_ID=CAMNT_0022688321 /DNA_START=157 /DNA_END=336 /DNA_ORIENTATION=+
MTLIDLATASTCAKAERHSDVELLLQEVLTRRLLRKKGVDQLEKLLVANLLRTGADVQHV